MRKTRSLGQALLKKTPLSAIVLGTLFCATFGYGAAPPFSVMITGLLGDFPLSQLTESQQNVIFEDPGTIIVFHGFGCAKSDRPGQEVVLKVEQSVDIPSYARNATVFLNDWRLKYLRDDHHVSFVKTAIRNARLEGQRLKWEAVGELSDHNFDDAYL